MGRKKIISQIKKRLTAAYAAVVLFLIFTAFLTLCMIAAKDLSLLPLVLLPFAAAVGFIIMILTWTNNPEKYCPHVKRDPKLMEKAEALFNKVIYEDKYIIVSDYVIASKKNLFQMVYRNEVVAICPGAHYRDNLTTADSAVLYSVSGTTYIYTRGIRNKDLPELYRKINELCPLSKLLTYFDRGYIENAMTRYCELKSNGITPTKENFFNEGLN